MRTSRQTTDDWSDCRIRMERRPWHSDTSNEILRSNCCLLFRVLFRVYLWVKHLSVTVWRSSGEAEVVGSRTYYSLLNCFFVSWFPTAGGWGSAVVFIFTLRWLFIWRKFANKKEQTCGFIWLLSEYWRSSLTNTHVAMNRADSACCNQQFVHLKVQLEGFRRMYWQTRNTIFWLCFH